MSEELIALIKDYSEKFRAWQALLEEERTVRAGIISYADEKGDEPDNLRDLLEEEMDNSGLREKQRETLRELKEAERKLFAFNFDHCEDPVLLGELEHLAQDYAARITWLQQFLDVYDQIMGQTEASAAEGDGSETTENKLESPEKSRETLSEAQAEENPTAEAVDSTEQKPSPEQETKAEAKDQVKAEPAAEAKPKAAKASAKTKTTSTAKSSSSKAKTATSKAKAASAKSSESKTKAAKSQATQTSAKAKTTDTAKASSSKAKTATSKTKADSAKTKTTSASKASSSGAKTTASKTKSTSASKKSAAKKTTSKTTSSDKAKKPDSEKLPDEAAGDKAEK